MKKVLPFILIFLFWGIFPASLSAVSLGQNGMMLTIFPELAHYPPHISSQKGTRLTYYVASAVIPDGRNIYYKDEYGEWVDSEGNRYRKEEGPSAAGHGLMQVSVVGHDKKAILDVRLFSYLDHLGQLTCTGQHLSVVDAPSCTGDFWLPPAFLASLKEGLYGDLRIIHLPYTLGGHTYQAIRFHHDNGRIVFVYDLDSGLLLYYGAAGWSPLQETVTRELEQATSTYLSHVELIHRRKIQWPWDNHSPPEWLESINRLQYTGTVTVVVPGSPLFPFGLEVEIQVTDRGNHWIQQHSLATMGAPAGIPPSVMESSRVSGISQIGGLWLPKETADILQMGQHLDTDPITGVVTTVSFKGAAEDGTPLLTIREEGEAGIFSNEYYYHQETGLLLAWIHHQAAMDMYQELYITALD